MSIREANVRFEYKKQGVATALLFSLLEFVLSAFLSITIASHILFPEQAEAAAGVSKKLAYQGRLTDTSGNPLSGTYYFCVSIYDASSAGTKLWPTGTPTSMSATVSSGVFNIGIGDSDTLGFDFSSNDTTYLNVEVASSNGTCGSSPFESLTPRQRIDATAYARVAADVYGDALRTSATKVQVGTGTGAATPIWMSLDWRNVSDTVGGACPSGSFNGAIWYNSSITRALMCKTSTVVALDNASEVAGIKEQSSGSTITSGTINFSGSNNITVSQTGSTLQFSVPSQSVQTQNLHNITLSGNTAGVMAQISSGTLSLAGGNNITLSQNGNAVTIIGPTGGGGGVAIGGGASTATSGTIVFSNANGVSFGLNGQTMTASVNAGGGAAPNLNLWMNNLGSQTGPLAGTANMSLLVFPLNPNGLFPGNMTVNTMAIGLSGSVTATASSSSHTHRVSIGIYTLNGSSLSLLNSASTSFGTGAGWTGNSAMYHGPRRLTLHSSQWSAAPTFSQTQYWVGLWIRSSNLAVPMSISGFRWITSLNSGQIGVSNTNSTTNRVFPGVGIYSVTFSTAMPASIAFSQLRVGGQANAGVIPYIIFNNVGE